jgi:hypothetical protein
METKVNVQELVVYLAQDVERLIKQTYPEFSLATFKPKKRSKSEFVDLKCMTIFILEDWFKVGRMDIARCLEKHYATVIYYAEQAQFFVKHKDLQFFEKFNKVIASIDKASFIEERKPIMQDYLRTSARKNKFMLKV